jgi:hypothetical protein
MSRKLAGVVLSARNVVDLLGQAIIGFQEQLCRQQSVHRQAGALVLECIDSHPTQHLLAARPALEANALAIEKTVIVTEYELAHGVHASGHEALAILAASPDISRGC